MQCKLKEEDEPNKVGRRGTIFCSRALQKEDSFAKETLGVYRVLQRVAACCSVL